MAYLSREFWKPDEERQAAVSAPQAAGSTLAPGASSANPVASAGTSQVDAGGAPGAIRSFFEANKDQGSQILGGLADSINGKIAGSGSRLEAVPTVLPQSDLVNLHPDNGPAQWAQDNLNSQLAAYNQQQTDIANRGKEIAARNTASVQPLASDIQALGSGQEGVQSLLDSRYAGSGYTPGQSRLDAWLAGSAANATPGVVGGTQDAYRNLQAAAATTQQNGAPPAFFDWVKALNNPRYPGPTVKG